MASRRSSTGRQQEGHERTSAPPNQRGKPRAVAVFAESGMQAVKRLSIADFRIDGLTLYGKLKGLTDRSRREEDDIWGELVEENGAIWRIKFKPSDLDKAKNFFTRQVMAVGNAAYFRANTPRLDVQEISADLPLDYLKGFDDFSSSYEDVFGDQDPEEIIREIMRIAIAQPCLFRDFHLH